MRVAVLSDIHANGPALEAVLAAVGEVEQVWVLGDIVGYGGAPGRGRGTASGGRGDRGAGQPRRGRAGPHPHGHLQRPGAQRGRVDRRRRSRRRRGPGWLALPDSRVEGDFTLVHGSPREPLWEYLISIPVARLDLAAFATPYCLVGHTHYPLTFRDDSGRVEVLAVGDGTRLALDERRCILNPGSVGQPRDGDPRACAMLIDTDAREVEWRRVEYPGRRDAARHPRTAPAGEPG